MIAVAIFDGVDTQYEQYTLYVYAVNITTAGLLPNGTQYSAYTTNLAASGGAGGYTYTIQGNLPAGPILASNGTISGTITAGPGVYGFTITATDTNHVFYSKNMTLDVIGSPIALMRITGFRLTTQFWAIITDGCWSLLRWYRPVHMDRHRTASRSDNRAQQQLVPAVSFKPGRRPDIWRSAAGRKLQR